MSWRIWPPLRRLSSGVIQLRPYQQEATKKLVEFLAQGKGRPLAVLPPGTGKSLICAELIRLARMEKPHLRVFVMAPSKELIQQNINELRRHCPEESSAGVYVAGLNLREARSMVLFCTIQSVYNRFDEITPPPADLIIIDEVR